jgi:hypothetical protein
MADERRRNDDIEQDQPQRMPSDEPIGRADDDDEAEEFEDLEEADDESDEPE